MAKYIINWNNEKQEVEFENMSQVEEYANNNSSETKTWHSITYIGE